MEGESGLAGARSGHLFELFQAAGLGHVEEVALPAPAVYSSLDDWWEPFTLGVGPAGSYARTLPEADLSALREGSRRVQGGRRHLGVPFGYVAHDEAADPAAPLDATITVGADGLISRLTV